MSQISQLRGSHTITSILALSLAWGTTHAEPLDLGLFERTSFHSINAFITVDNSASMTEELNGRFQWDAANYQQELSSPLESLATSMSTVSLNRDIPTCDNSVPVNMNYIFGNDAEIHSLVSNPLHHTSVGCHYIPLKNYPKMFALDWRYFSYSGNSLYYNPNRTYEPWPGYPNAVFSRARLNPHPMNANYNATVNLGTTAFYPNDGFHFNIWKDNGGFEGSYPTPRNYKKESNNEVDLWDEHLQYRVTPTSIEVKRITYDSAMNADIATCDFENENPLVGHETCFGRREATQTFASLNFGRSITQEQQNIANWFQYYRSRSLESRGSLAKIVMNYPQINFGITSLGNRADKKYFIPVRGNGVPPRFHERRLLRTLFSNWEYIYRTPLAASALFTGEYFESGLDPFPSPIADPCSKNLSITMTDGNRSSDWDESRSDIIDHDGDGTRHETTPEALTIGDIASYFYNTDLAPTLPDLVAPSDMLCPSIDPVSHQALTQINFVYGTPSQINTADRCWPFDDPKTNEPWGKIFPTGGAYFGEDSYRDLWHAAYNSRGFFSFISNSDMLVDKLDKYLTKSVVQGSYTGPTAASHNRITPNSQFFKSRFNLNINRATVTAHRLDSAGNIDTSDTLWSIGDETPESRPALISYNPATGTGVQLAQSQAGPITIPTAISEVLFPESSTLDADQTRFIEKLYTTPLGPVLHSNLLYVGNPSARHQFRGSSINTALFDSDFTTFTKKSRRPMLYFNSNDGKVYGVDADTGKEVLSYIPSPVLTTKFAQNSPENFDLFLDGENYIADAVLENRGWSTVLVGSMRQGGQGYFALDISDPDSFGAENVLWEFTDKDDPDLGLTYSKPAFGAFENNRFYAVLSNGYNATVTSPDDQNASNTGQAALYILNLSTGEIVKKFTTGIGMAQDPTGQNRPNGFAEPALVDIDRNGLIDRIYVGDYFGNMYAFDLSNASPSDWASAYGSPTAPIPLVQGGLVNHQPITSRPAITKNPKSDHILVIYGTGEDITTTSNLQPNFLLAVKDEEPVATTEDLVRRSLSTDGSTWSIDEPLTSGTVTDDDQLNAAKGWYFPLTGAAAGFNITQQPLLRYGQLIWTANEYSVTTSESVSCQIGMGEKSHVIAMSPFSGLGLEDSIFPTLPEASASTSQPVVDGQTLNQKIHSLDILTTEKGELIMGNGFAKGTLVVPKKPMKNVNGRQSWRRL